jgi:RimJ/RimL family protein N-acetyltransferase
MTIYLETDRLILRRFGEADLDNLVDLDSDPEVMRYLTGGVPTPRHVVETVLLPRIIHSYERDPGFGTWAAIEKSTGAFAGWFGLTRALPDTPGTAELGYRLRRPVWGKGYATEGAQALIRKAFRELGVERVVATTYQDNLASRRVMEKAGLSFVRGFRPTLAELSHDGLYPLTEADMWDGDDVEYAIRREDWERRSI